MQNAFAMRPAVSFPPCCRMPGVSLLLRMFQLEALISKRQVEMESGENTAPAKMRRGPWVLAERIRSMETIPVQPYCWRHCTVEISATYPTAWCCCAVGRSYGSDNAVNTTPLCK